MRNKALSIAFNKKREQKFEVAMGLFILAKDFKSAIQVAIKDLQDSQLAILVYRLMVTSTSNQAESLQILYVILLEKLMQDRQFEDLQVQAENEHSSFNIACQSLNEPFLICIFWMLADRKDLAFRSLTSRFERVRSCSSSTLNQDFLKETEKRLGLLLGGNSWDVTCFIELVKQTPEFKRHWANIQGFHNQQGKIRSLVTIVREFFPMKTRIRQTCRFLYTPDIYLATSTQYSLTNLLGTKP